MNGGCPQKSCLPASLPPRGLSRVQAAEYIGIGATKFDEMVDDGRMRLNTEAHHGHNNPVGTLAVNISLAIRRAFDRLAEHRGQRDRTAQRAPP